MEKKKKWSIRRSELLTKRLLCGRERQDRERE